MISIPKGTALALTYSPIHHPHSPDMAGATAVGDAYCYDDKTHLTVKKTSLFFSGDGFTAYDSHGALVFRVDSYGPDSRDRDNIVLMDASGKSLLTLRRKWPSLHQRWEGFMGERSEGQRPFFSVRRSSIIGRSSVTVEVFGDAGAVVEEYQIVGSFPHRSCTFYSCSKEVVAEIKRKMAPCANVMLGNDVFLLCFKPSFDGAFAMGLVLVLDQISGDAIADDDDVAPSVAVVNPSDEDRASCLPLSA